jgi:hypothetical protein
VPLCAGDAGLGGSSRRLCIDAGVDSESCWADDVWMRWGDTNDWPFVLTVFGMLAVIALIVAAVVLFYIMAMGLGRSAL